MSTKNPDAPQPEQQPGSSGSRWEPTAAEANAPTEQVASPPAAEAAPAPASAPASDAAPTAAARQYPDAAATPAAQAPSSTTFASLKALSTGARGALAGAAAVLVLGSGVTGFAIGQAGDDGHQRIDVRFGQAGFDRDGDSGRGGFPGQMGQLPGQPGQQDGAGRFEGQLPQPGGTTDGQGGPTQNDGSES
ncbi:hypothetical protein [Nocardioides jiangxiensis]|uniref:Translation initiation factor IF-2 n=1 Tax=Nocardioides jiangxiensis TaxID=3064524 RepID=A0ABT9B260_9ACTN|nr:hypothetical protein [Nocardioides sp. WY-20]MDO7868840.1 hypothetical protein [Nocardioides sp. WY-20]